MQQVQSGTESIEAIESAVTITSAAAKQIVRSLAKKAESQPNVFLRVAVKGGGCSGLSYVMEPDFEVDDRDLTWHHEAGASMLSSTAKASYS